jgi:hypothetical protein
MRGPHRPGFLVRFRAALLVGLGIVSAACAGPARQSGSGIVVPLSVGEGHNAGARRRGAPSNSGTSNGPGQAAQAANSAVPGVPSNASGAPAAPGPAPSTDFGTQPDPVPLMTAHQWELSLHYAKGAVKFEGARPVELKAPAATPRQIGRFAVELWVGKELVDRVRFDFPLLAADGPPGGDRRPVRGAPRFSPGADTRSNVRVPASGRATMARVVDRQTGSVVSIPWPPGAEGVDGASSNGAEPASGAD